MCFHPLIQDKFQRIITHYIQNREQNHCRKMFLYFYVSMFSFLSLSFYNFLSIIVFCIEPLGEVLFLLFASCSSRHPDMWVYAGQTVTVYLYEYECVCITNMQIGCCDVIYITGLLWRQHLTAAVVELVIPLLDSFWCNVLFKIFQSAKYQNEQEFIFICSVQQFNPKQSNSNIWTL